MIEIFFLSFLLAFSGIIAIFSAIALVVSLFAFVDDAKWWIVIILSLAISIGLCSAAKCSLETLKLNKTVVEQAE